MSWELPNNCKFAKLLLTQGVAQRLSDEDDTEAGALSADLTPGGWQANIAERGVLATLVRVRAARNLARATAPSGAPVEPAALPFWQLRLRASHQRSLRPRPAARARGIVDYLYELDRTEARHETFANDGTEACGQDACARKTHKLLSA